MPVSNQPDRGAKRGILVVAGIISLGGSIVLALAEPAGLGWDFHLYYMAGRIPAEELYLESAQSHIEAQLWKEHRGGHPFSYAPFLKPAYYRLILVPLAQLPYWPAFCLWVGVQFAAIITALAILCRRYGLDPAFYVLVPISPYFVLTLLWGQDTGLVLLAVVSAWEMLMRGRECLAGFLLALGLVKYNVLLPLLAFPLVRRRWKMAAGLSALGAAEIVVSIGITGLDGVRDYVALLSHPAADFLAAGMPSFRGALLSWGVPRTAVLPLTLLANAAVLLGMRRLALEHAFAVGIAAGVILSYHTMIYDLLFLFVPISILRKEVAASRWVAPLVVFLMSPLPRYLAKFAGEGVLQCLVLTFGAWLAFRAVRGQARPGL